MGIQRAIRRSGLFLLAAACLAYAGSCEPLAAIRDYIGRTWTGLLRSNATLLKSAADSKIGQSGRVVLYVPRGEDPDKIAARLRSELTPSQFNDVTVRPLPERGEPAEPGLLYLPHPYVVPGGRFNEMYGWDSYFIVRGLLADGKVQLAKDMTDNLVYEVEHYGKVLNANRTYYLTRSQPPFLTRMILEVFRRTGDTAWLAGTLPAVEAYYAYWTREPRLTPRNGLSRYHGGADTPAPEVVHGERDSSGRSHYDKVRKYYRTHNVTAYDVSQFYDRANDRLTPLFYLGDRAARESGFDPSSRFGPFSVDIIHYNPVCLNSLLYRMERDTSAIYTLLDRPRAARLWARRAERRAETVNRLMWDERAGLYFDYNFRQHRRSAYPFLTAFYPLWVGIAPPERAARVEANLPLFERAGGLQTLVCVTGQQWDAPFAWAPLQIVATEGLRRYGFTEAADRIGGKFLSMVLRDFAEHGVIKEKYDAVTTSSDLAAGLRFGYDTNEIGFGWTNAAFLAIYNELRPSARQAFDRGCGAVAAAAPAR
jgi:alpha,alpha-trehalase